MKNVILAVKVLALLGAFALLTWSAVPSPADAAAPTLCSGSGHTCHVSEPGGEVIHHKQN